jgi:hypothetical protein
MLHEFGEIKQYSAKIAKNHTKTKAQKIKTGGPLTRPRST